MADPVCNVCRMPITDSEEKKPKFYLIALTGRVIEQRKHDACHAAYMEGKVGLSSVAGPIPTDAERRALKEKFTASKKNASKKEASK